MLVQPLISPVIDYADACYLDLNKLERFQYDHITAYILVLKGIFLNVGLKNFAVFFLNLERSNFSVLPQEPFPISFYEQ